MGKKKKRRKPKKTMKKKIVRRRSRTKKRIKIRYGRILFALLLLALILYLFFHLFQFRLRNIYISGNTYLGDQEIIELAGIEDYPSTFMALSFPTKRKLERDARIKSAKVWKWGLTEIHIKIEENIPLFYNKSSQKTVLKDGSEVEDTYAVAILINYVPDKIYDKLVHKMAIVDDEILKRISEIEYKPNEVDSNRFLLSMKDGNYVYLTLGKWKNINNYVEMIRKFSGKKGILYLDSGEYFKVLEG